jgi:uncharacterized protein
MTSDGMDDDPVTIVTQTRVRPESNDAFGRWQEETSKVVAGFSGFIDQKLIPPSPPAHVDWVILQRFAKASDAVAWLQSEQRLTRIQHVTPMLIGSDDIHMVKDGGGGALPAPVSVVISSRVRPGQEVAYRQWEQRIAAAQSKAKGFQGYRLEPPIPGVQEEWLAILRFDTQDNLQAWLNSAERQRLLHETRDFLQDVRTRIAQTGFDQWFPAAAGRAPAPAWKQNMLVLLMLYPVVFLFGTFVQAPLLQGRLGLAFPTALFIGNVTSVLLLNFLVPWTSRRFGWWLDPDGKRRYAVEIAGTALIVLLYGLLLLAFSPRW